MCRPSGYCRMIWREEEEEEGQKDEGGREKCDVG